MVFIESQKDILGEILEESSTGLPQQTSSEILEVVLEDPWEEFLEESRNQFLS